MKALVFLLLLANLVYYAFTAGYFGRPSNPDANRIDAQVAPEKIRIVSRGEAPAVTEVAKVEASAEPGAEIKTPVDGAKKEEVKPEPAKTEAAKPEVVKPEAPKPEAAKPEAVPMVCLAWEHLPLAQADKVSALLGSKFADFKVERQVVAGEGNGWWVFVPPLPGKVEAEKKAGELRQLGVDDYFIIHEGPNRFAISLGIFSSEKGAQDRLGELKSQGVRSAKVMPRPGKDGTVSLKATGPATARVVLVDAVGKILPKPGVQDCK